MATRQRAPLAPEDAALVGAFVEAHLLVTSEAQSHEPLVEVAHEALFRSWDMLRDWVQLKQDHLRLLRQFERDARDWERRDKPLELRPRNEQVTLLLDAAENLRIEVADPLLVEYADLDRDAVLREIEDLATSHRRRLLIGERLGLLGDPRPGVGNEEVTIAGRTLLLPDIEWCYVAAPKDARGRFPRLNVGGNHELRPFWIARYPITRQQFQVFIDAPDGYSSPTWWTGTSSNRVRHKIFDNRGRFPSSPRDTVTWYQATAFTHWLSAQRARMTLRPPDAGLSPDTIGANVNIRLPNEWEWQWAAEAREYPWRGAWDGRRANTFEAGLGESTVVGMYPGGAAACGALDMAGNLWDWCLNSQSRGRTRGVRGGAFYGGQDGARCAFRDLYGPFNFDVYVGFRVVCAAAPG